MLIGKNAEARTATAANAVVVSLVLLALVLGCGRGGAPPCTGELTRAGKTFTGQAKTESDARLFACNKYCLELDPEFDAMYRIWLDSPQGRKTRNPSKEKALEDRRLLDYVTITCANRCVSEAEAGKGKLAVTCR